MTRLTKELLDSVAGFSSRDAAIRLGVGKSTINDARRRLSEGSLTASEPLLATEVPSGKFKVLALDLETAPNLGYFWGLWNQNIGIKQLESSTEVICFGARWLDEEEVTFRSVHHQDKKTMLTDLWELVNEADAVMGWNSKGFDSKHVNREFLEAEMLPPQPWKELDLMLAVKKVFRFPSNKLDYVAQRLGVGAKVQHSGFELWRRCMQNDPEAWEEMKTYQIQDVDLLIDLYYKLQPWIKGHPSVGLYEGSEYACTNCGSLDLTKDGFAYTGASAFQRFRCKNCGTPQRGSKAVSRSHMRGIA